MKSSDQPGAQMDAALSQAIDRLWVRFLPEIRQRVAILESAANAVTAKKLTPAAREAAQAAAHKLAGELGTFNLKQGTELARELERMLSGKSSLGPSAGKRLVAIAAKLRVMIERRPSTS